MKLLVTVSVVLSLLAVQSVLSAPAGDVDCDKMEEIINEYGPAQGFTVLSAKHPLPGTEEEYANKCTEMKEAIQTLRKYNSKCNTALTQQVFGAILRSRAAFNEVHCNLATPEGKGAIESVKCMKENALEKMKEAEKKFLLYGQVVLDANIADEKLRLRNACCAIVSGCKVFMDSASEKCGSYSKMFATYLDSYKSEAMSLICPTEDKLECDKLEKIKIEGVEAKGGFFLNPILKLVKTMDH